MVATEHELFTVEEVAQRRRVSRRMVYRLVEQGKMEALRIGDLYRIPRESLEAFMRTARGEKTE